MKLHAIYVNEFKGLKNCTINLHPDFDYQMNFNSYFSSVSIERVENGNDKLTYFYDSDTKICGLIGKNGSGKTTISQLIKSLFADSQIMASVKVFVIFEIEGRLFFDKYEYSEYIKQHYLEIVSIDKTNNFELVNLTGNRETAGEPKFYNFPKKIIFYSSFLSEMNQLFYENGNIIDLSLDFRLREFINQYNFPEEGKNDFLGYKNVVSDFFFKNNETFIEMLFKLKNEHPSDHFFSEINPMPETLSYVIQFDLERIREKLNFAENSEFHSLPFFVILKNEHTTSKNVKSFVSNHLKSYLLINEISSKNKNPEIVANFSIKISSFVDDFTIFNDLVDGLSTKLQKIDELVDNVEFQVHGDLFQQVEAVCNESASALFSYIKSLNQEHGLNYITLNAFHSYSSGEQVLMNLFTRLEEHLPSINQDVIFFFDEIDLHLHPEWQRQIIFKLLQYFNSRAISGSQLIFTTHSPYVISEFPKHNLKLYSSNPKYELNTWKSPDAEISFAANLNNILVDLMGTESLHGEMTREIVNDAIAYLKNKDSIHFKSDEDIENLLGIIGEPLLKFHLGQMLKFKKPE